MAPRPTQLLLIALLALPPLPGQMVKDPAHKGEFPGLSLLPPGSIVRGVSLPRYEKRRVASHVMADMLEVVSTGKVRLLGIRSSLYSENGEETVLTLDKALYNFETEMMESHSGVTVQNPRFRASGASVSFSNTRQQGLVRGPVNTIINTSAFTAPKEQKTKP